MNLVTLMSRPSSLRLHATYHAVLARNVARRSQWELLSGGDTYRREQERCSSWQEARPYAHIKGCTGDPRLDAAIDAEARRRHVSYFCQYRGNLLVEPRYGYLIDAPLRLVKLSMPFVEWSQDPAFRHLIGFPAVGSAIAARLGITRVRHLERVISLRFYWEDNYFHFLNDILPRVKLANDAGIPRDVPVLVGKRLARSRFFQSAFPDGTIDGRRVIDQGDDFIAAREVIFSRPGSHARDSLVYSADLQGAPAKPAGSRRIFLIRAKSRGRYIDNMDELFPILSERGVTVVDTDHLTVPEQVELFSSAECVIGVHGAGLGNTIFRRGAPCKILEIFPPYEAVISFPLLADQLGFAYDAMSGCTATSVVDRFQPFSVSPDLMRTKIDRLLRRPVTSN